MLAYGYEVEGSPEALADVSENLKDRRSCILALRKHIRGLLRLGLCDARYVPHFCV